MFKKITLSAAIAATALTALPAAADARPRSHYDGRGAYAQPYQGQNYRYASRYDARRYDQRRYNAPRYESRSYGRYYGQRCNNDNTAGALIGAIAGGLLGSSVAGRGDHTVGALIGGGAGALIGSAIAKGDDCRR
jgi:uncharacterized protein YcfJ